MRWINFKLHMKLISIGLKRDVRMLMLYPAYWLISFAFMIAPALKEEMRKGDRF